MISAPTASWGEIMNDSAAPARAKTSRRTLLAGAAWSVPVIAAAVAAPQVAASGGDAHLNLSTHSIFAIWSSGAKTGVEYQIGLYSEYIQNAPSQPTVTQIDAAITLPASLFGSSVPQVVSGANWASMGSSLLGDHIVFKFRWTGVLLTTGPATPMLDVKVMASTSFSSVSTSITATSPQQAAKVAIVNSPTEVTV